MKQYSTKKFLNPMDSSYTGTVCAFYGPAHWKENKINCYFSVGDCTNIIRLHLEDENDIRPFIRKLQLLADEAANFAEWLDKNIEELENKNETI